MLVGVIIDGHGIVERYIAGNGGIVIGTVKHWRTSCPEDDGVRVRVSRSHPMTEVQLGGRVDSGWVVAFVDLVDGDTQTRVIM